MKIKLELEIDEKELKKEEGFVSKEQVKENLIDSLFEICEDWVIRGQEPDFEFEK